MSGGGYKFMKQTKHKLLSSIATLVVCIAMLIGSTYAWFTDSASTGVNRIQAGNLDIEVEYMKGSTWQSVEGKTDLFAEDTLWEPGHTEVVYLKLTNKGNLALDYKLQVYAAAETTGINMNNQEFKLSEKLVYSVVDQGETHQTYTRDQARAAATSTFTLGTAPLTKDEVTPGTVQYIALVVYMPETVGNEANALPGTTVPFIDLKIRLDATQATVEHDSFDKYYDREANGNPDHPEFDMPIDTVVTKSGALPSSVSNGMKVVSTSTNVNAGGITVTYDNGVKTNQAAQTGETEASSTFADAKQGLVYTGTDSSYSNITVAGTDMLGVYDLTLPVAADNTVLVKIVKNIGPGQLVDSVYHNGTALTNGSPSANASVTGDEGYYSYNTATGELSIWVLHASEITVKYTSRFAGGKGTESDPYLIATPEQFRRILSGSATETRYYKLINDVDLSSVFDEDDYAVYDTTRYIVLDGNGNSLKGVDDGMLFKRIENSTLKNLTVDMVGGESAISLYAYYKMHYDHVNVTGEASVSGNNGAYAILAFAADFTFDNCIADVDMSGTSYNSVFVGYVYTYSGTQRPVPKFTFNNCENKGSLVCNYAAMFIGNPNAYDIVCNVNNCVNSGVIQSTNTDNVLNYYYAVTSNCYRTFKINDVTYNDIADGRSSAPSCYEDTNVTTTGRAIHGPQNTGMTLTQNANGTFTITDATIEGKTVDHYTVFVGVYAALKEGGSSRNYVTETISASGSNRTTELKNISFVDSEWVEAHSAAERGHLAGNTVYTLGEATYYMLVTPETDTLHGRPKAPQMIYVVAYDANNKTLASASLLGDIA